jgi:sugar lactone lactonase YvrE
MTNSGQITCVVPAGDRCGEGAVWSAAQQAVFWTDINRFLIHRYDLATTAVRTWFFAEPVVALMLTDDSDILAVAFASKISLWHTSHETIVREIFSLPTAPRMRCNDARVDPRGSIWMGTMLNNVGPDGEDLDLEWKDGVLYRIDPDGTSTEWKRNIGISNTVVWSPDRSTFYFADTPANMIYAYDYKISEGTISGERPFLSNYSSGLPDGSAMDAEGCFWNARPGSGSVIRVRPDGTVDREIKLPVRRPTTCIFGGADLKTLFITSAASAERLAGSLFALNTGVAGLPDNEFPAFGKSQVR